MARTGRFGRAPRQATSLTNTLVAIARQFQQQRDDNLMSAWQKGGLFEGQKATDELVLKHWADRVKSVSKDDPLHDTYQLAHDQLDYTIHESKMTAAFAQHKATDAQMVNFYLGWAKKVPKDSEFYRVLQRDAGQYMRTSQAQGRASAAQAKELAYQNQQNATHQHKEAAGEYIIDTFRRIAQSGNANAGIGALIGAPGSSSDLTDFDPTDPEQMMRLLALIAPPSQTKVAPGGETYQSGPNAGNPEVLFHTDNGHGVTGQEILDTLAKKDPSWKPGTPIDVGYATGLLDRQVQGLDERIARAQSSGHMADVTSLGKSKEYVAEVRRLVAAMPVEPSIMEARSTYDAVVADKTSSPQAIMNAWNTYAGFLRTVAQDPRIATNDNLRSRIVAEANRQPGVPTVAETFTGLNSGAYDQQSATDNEKNDQNLTALQNEIDSVQSGKAFWTYGDLKDGVFHPRAGGTSIGAAGQDELMAGGENPKKVTVPDPRGGMPITMMVTAVPVFAVATDPITGKKLDATNAKPIAWAYDMPNGGTTTTHYAFKVNGEDVYSTVGPWDSSLRPSASSSGGNHLEIDLSPVISKVDANQYNVDGDIPGAPGFQIKGAKNGQPGQIVFDPQVASAKTDTRSTIGGRDQLSDFDSLTFSNLMSSVDGRNILSNLDKYPTVKQQLDFDVAVYAGGQVVTDPKTGQATVDMSKADPAKLARGQNTITIAAETNGDLQSFVDKFATGWQKTQIGNPLAGKTEDDLLAGNLPKLADQVQGTQLHAAGVALSNFAQNGYQTPGTNTQNLSTAQQLSIRAQGTIKVPAVEFHSLVQPGTAATYTPPGGAGQTQSGSQPPTQTGSAPPGSTQQGSQPPSNPQDTYDAASHKFGAGY